jgi:hypothetical protein
MVDSLSWNQFPAMSVFFRRRFIITALVPGLIVGCAARSRWQQGTGDERIEADGTEIRRALVKNRTEEFTAVHSDIDDVARYLAGLPGGRNSPLRPLRDEANWALHTNNLDELWRRFDTLRRAPIDSWAQAELGRLRSPDVLFYPFSGPDFLFADAFFPGADTCVLCGLESSDMLPDIARLTAEQRHAALDGLYASLTSSLNFSFFITKDLRVDLQRTELKGTLPILLVFLARSGHSIDSVQLVALDADGSPISRGAADSGSSGLMIRYRGRGGGGHTLYYFTTNLANDSFSAKSRFAQFLERLGPSVTFTKSASYLMHESSFSNIKNFILAHSIAVLEDDSGIPLRDFDPNNWQVTHYGRYSGVIGMFARYYQPDLGAAHGAGASPLGFGIGYKHQQGQSAMILARRR